MSENFDNLFYLPSDEQPTEIAMVTQESPMVETQVIEETSEYKHINYHWFYSDIISNKNVWTPMSYRDSACLERVYMDNK